MGLNVDIFIDILSSSENAIQWSHTQQILTKSEMTREAERRWPRRAEKPTPCYEVTKPFEGVRGVGNGLAIVATVEGCSRNPGNSRKHKHAHTIIIRIVYEG